MLRTRIIVAVLVVSLPIPAIAADWLTAPSYYTHDWTNGHRVTQYAPVGPFYYPQRADYSKSGYRHYRSTLDLGNSSDAMHVVEQWGAPIVPYEQWRFPYRPYSVPYGAWGPPYGGLGGGTGGYPYSGGGFGFPGPFFPPFGGGPGIGFPSLFQPPVNFAQPWLDGHYPSYDFNDRSRYWQPYTPPVPPRF